MPELKHPSPKFKPEAKPNQNACAGGLLEKFWLYETRQRFYLLGCGKDKKYWRVLKIDRWEPSELNISEDPVAYSQEERNDLLQRIADGNRATGGLSLVSKAFGIAGCVKFLGSYYLILVTKRRQVGSICDNAIYGIDESQIISIPHSSVQTEVTQLKAEQRYKRLLASVDLTKDFFFSFSYPIMRSLQRNMFASEESEKMPYDNMFVWNSFLTQSIRERINNTCWTIPLVHGSFEQAKMSIFGRVFVITLIARRSRHFAGTRYLKRGVNDKGRVANDVETEQIIIKEQAGFLHWEATSVVQMRGSIPLFWSQETSRLSPKPDIILQRYDPTYQATKLHFEDLAKRYGNPIIILNLIKTVEKRPREMMLRREFASAVGYLNQILPSGRQLQFIHWDFHKFAKSKSANVLAVLAGVASQAFELTGFYYSGRLSNCGRPIPCVAKSAAIEREEKLRRVSDSQDGKGKSREPRYQNGVLRTNCIDCLDRTNVAQYAYGLEALGFQLFALGLTDVPKVDPDSSIAGALMDMYQNMGDALALQYGGSAAHNTVFPERHGKWKAATQSQEFLKSIKRYYSNTYTDGEKQDAINLFLGYFQPQVTKPALWELDSDYYLHVGSHEDDSCVQDAWPLPQVKENAMGSFGSSNCPSRGALERVKLTSFDKLIEATSGFLRNVRICSEQENKSTKTTNLFGTAPDAVEIQLQSPNWIYGQGKQEVEKKVKSENNLANAKECEENNIFKTLFVLDNSCETEVFERYLKAATTEDDSWYGCGILPGSIVDSEANRHYAQCLQDTALEPFEQIADQANCDGNYEFPDNICEHQDEAVVSSMEGALRDYEEVGWDLGSIACGAYPEDSDILTHWIVKGDLLHNTCF